MNVEHSSSKSATNRLPALLAGVAVATVLLLGTLALRFSGAEDLPTKPAAAKTPVKLSLTSIAKNDEVVLSNAIQQFRLDCDRFPTAEEGLEALSVMPRALSDKWKGPYVDMDFPNDPWGTPYKYRSPDPDGSADSYLIATYGSDKLPGGDGGASDVIERG